MQTTLHRATALRVDPETLYRLLRLRVDVFVVEQECPYPELDGRDLEADTELFWAEREGEPVATLRLLRDDDGARIGRVATSEGARGDGLAGSLMRRAIGRASQRWPGAVVRIDAQERLVAWYAGFGFRVSGARFIEDGIAHVPMHLLPPT